MSLAYSARTDQTASLAWRQFHKALVWTSGVVGFACGMYCIEKYLVQPHKRFLENPTEAMIRSFGLAHFVVGWFFMFTSRQLRSRTAMLRLAPCTAAGVALCWAFAALGGVRSLLAVFGFYAFFLVHSLRDDAELTHAYDGAAGPERFRQRLVVCVTLLFVVALGALHLARGLITPAHLAGMPPVWLLTGWSLLFLAWTGSAFAVRAEARRSHGGLAAALAAHTPLPQIYAVLLVVLLVGSLLGSVGFHLLILIHASTWLVFVMHRQRQVERPARDLLAWMRHTPAGFLTLYLTLSVLFLVVLALRVYVWQRGGWISATFASSSFPYWSLMHITMAFWKK